jgi:tRNA A-37 threonylcarbamoyl transferase component Bud32
MSPADPTDPPDPRSMPAPPHIPGHAIKRPLGKGGMATVYLATQQSLDRLVAIKVMAAEALRDEVSKQRFENEARTIAQLAHPGIVGIHEVGRTDDGRMYYVMPYLANGDLSRRDLREDEPRIADILRSLLSALGMAHARGIVHRDVKRENVLFDAGDRPLLTDFGIATSRAGDTSRLTSAGTALGSSAYMAPEQARGVRVDARADLYSVGVLAYELLTGKLPYQADDALAMALMHSQDAIPRLPPGRQHWQAFIDRAMAKSPDGRYANAQQMLEALDRVASDRRAAAARPDPRPRLLLAGAALLLLVAVGYALNAYLAKDDAVAPVVPEATVAAAPPPAPAAEPMPAPADEGATPDSDDGADSAPPESTPPESAPPDSAPPDPAPSAPAPAAPPPANPPPPAKPTLAQRAKNAKGKVKRWFRRH